MYEIKQISTSGSGERLLLKLLSPDGESESVSISCDAYRELGLKKGEISDEIYEKLIVRTDYEDALIKGIRILGYGANSKKQLALKLCRVGISRENAKRACDELSARGYLDEKNDALRIAEGMLAKKYGKRKILASLRAKGYSDDAISFVDGELLGYDFLTPCTELVRKRMKNLTADRAQIQKAIAKLVGLGYNVGEAKQAVMRALNEEQTL
jgi:SOS response regulatory protein OraA/RecX